MLIYNESKKATHSWLHSNNKQLIEISCLAQALFQSKAVRHWKALKRQRIKQENEREYLREKRESSPLGEIGVDLRLNWVRCKMAGKRERENSVVRLMTISFFHVLFISSFFFCPFSSLVTFAVFFLPKDKMQRGKGSVVSSSSCDRNSPSLPLPHSLCPSPNSPQSILDTWCQLWATVKLYPSPSVAFPPPSSPTLT